MAAIREFTLRFVYHPAAARLAMVAFALVALLLQPNAPVNGGGGS